MRDTRKKKTITKTAMLAAIKGSGGVISSIARRLDTNWHTANTYTQKWAETIHALEDERETILDMAETTVYGSIKEGNTQDAKWLLATKGKNRGFTDRHEITGADGSELKITYEIVHAHNENPGK